MKNGGAGEEVGEREGKGRRVTRKLERSRVNWAGHVERMEG